VVQNLDLAQLQVIPLESKQCLKRFDCGNSDINGLAGKAHKWHERNRARIFSAHETGAAWGLGFYSLSILAEDVRKIGTREAQFYDFGVPLIYVDALGVRSAYQGQGLGRLLLIDALKRAFAVSKNVAIYGVALKSLNDRTTKFYEKHGFGLVGPEEKNPLMVVPIWTLRDLFDQTP
jgi:GNAT superfamily N-acetyltransferase